MLLTNLSDIISWICRIYFITWLIILIKNNELRKKFFLNIKYFIYSSAYTVLEKATKQVIRVMVFGMQTQKNNS